MDTFPLVFVVCFVLFVAPPTWGRVTPNINNNHDTAAAVNKNNNIADYTTKYFDQPIDHFDFVRGAKTFKQRYLISAKSWTNGTGPIFFYTGNEGAITAFYENSGFLMDIAPEFNALLVFAEHRYYGESLPFGKESFDKANIGLLSVEQALADYAVLITHLKSTLNAASCPVIVFGGSYGGMLSAYMRFKYPNLVAGALAASAPIYLTAGLMPNSTFFQDVTKDFAEINPKCPQMVRSAFIKMNELVNKGYSGLATISDTFRLCKPLTSQDEIPHLQGWVRNAFTTMAMMDYPYSADFMSSLPAYPVKYACGLLLNETDALKGLAKAAGIAYNGTAGSLKCFEIHTEFIECADPTGCGLGTDSSAWDYQACTEISLPGGSNNKTDMFPDLPFTPAMREEYCHDKWGITPYPTWLNVQMWGKDIKTSSNIIFSNGLLDPWHRGGVLTDISKTIIAIQIKEGAHHLDLRGKNAADPPSVIKARNQEKKLIKSWIKAYN